MSIKFTHGCPTCGRRIQVRAALMGRTVACPHCHAEFVAGTGAERGAAPRDGSNVISPVDPLMQRVEQALQRVERMHGQPAVS